MKKIIALMLALLLAAGCTSALAEMPDLQNGVTIQAGINVNADAFAALSGLGGDDSTAPLVNAIVGIINEAGIQAVINGNGLQADVLLKDSSILQILAAPTETGLALTADAVEGYAFTVQNETIQAVLSQLQSAMPEGMNGLDPEALAEAILPVFENLLTGIMDKVGDPEAGTFQLEDGQEYNLKAPINITTKELATLVLSTVNDVIGQEALAPVLSQIEGFDPAQIQQALEQIENTPEEDMPVTDAAIYLLADEEGNQKALMVAVDMTKDDETLSLRAGQTADNAIVFTLNIGDQGAVNVRVDITDNGAVVTAAFKAGEQFMMLQTTVSAVEGGVAVLADLYFSSADAPILSVAAQVQFSGEVAPIDLEGKELIPVESLMGELDEDASEALNGIAQNAVQNILMKAMQAMPDEFGTIMQMFMPAEQETVTAE